MRKKLVITLDDWVMDGDPETERNLVSFWGLTAKVRLRMETTTLHRRRRSDPSFIGYLRWAEHDEGIITNFYLILPGKQPGELVLSFTLYIIWESKGQINLLEIAFLIWKLRINFTFSECQCRMLSSPTVNNNNIMQYEHLHVKNFVFSNFQWLLFCFLQRMLSLR